jgi:hypothetical protein
MLSFLLVAICFLSSTAFAWPLQDIFRRQTAPSKFMFILYVVFFNPSCHSMHTNKSIQRRLLHCDRIQHYGPASAIH